MGAMDGGSSDDAGCATHANGTRKEQEPAQQQDPTTTPSLACGYWQMAPLRCCEVVQGSVETAQNRFIQLARAGIILRILSVERLWNGHLSFVCALYG